MWRLGVPVPRPTTKTPRPAWCSDTGSGCVRRTRLDHAFARRFCDVGLTALAFDYRHFGDSEGHPRQLIDIERQLEDWRAGVAFARGLTAVDPHRVALWGTSLAGGHVVAIAATDPEIASVVSQIPFTGGVGVARRTGLVHSLRLTRRPARRTAGAALPRPTIHPALRPAGHPGGDAGSGGAGAGRSADGRSRRQPLRPARTGAASAATRLCGNSTESAVR